MAEINVTPLVDVMLVLLIIFMVAAPLMTVGVPVDLPKTTAQPLNQETEPLTITVNPEGKIFLQETEVPLDGLVPRLQAIMREQAQGAPDFCAGRQGHFLWPRDGGDGHHRRCGLYPRGAFG
jgi:biopolymer transport protein TolR